MGCSASKPSSYLSEKNSNAPRELKLVAHQLLFGAHPSLSAEATHPTAEEAEESLTLEELSSRLTGLAEEGFATEEAAREYARASIIGRRQRHSLSASITAVAAVRIMEEQANSARLARASESPADSAASGSPTPLELAPFLGVKQGDGVTQGFWGARLTMTLLVMPMQGLCL